MTDPCMTCETLRDRIRDLELAFVEQTARCAELACEFEKAKALSVEERTRGLCDAVELIERRANEQGAAVCEALLQIAAELRGEYFKRAEDG